MFRIEAAKWQSPSLEMSLKVTGLEEVTQAKGEFFQRSSPLHSFPGGALFFFLSRTAVLWWYLRTTKEGRRLSASLDAACLELVPLPRYQKALRGETRRRALPVMCCRANPGPYLKSFVKKKKKTKNQSAFTQNCGVLLTVHLKRGKAAAAVITGGLPWEPGVRLPPCVY